MNIELFGEHLQLRGDRTLYWPARKSLYAADLHWGKSEVFHAHGIGIPAGMLDSDLARLEAALRETGAERLVILGDLVHNPRYLGPELIAKLQTWRQRNSHTMLLIPGNHDRGLKELQGPLALEVLDQSTLIEAPFRFTHDATQTEVDMFTWSGHIHPRFRGSLAGSQFRAPCFVIEHQRGLLPAFSEFTAGVDIERRPSRKLFVVVENQVVEI